MLKIIPPGSYDFSEPAIQLIKFARYGLGPNDRHELCKRASEEFVEQIRRLEPKSGDELAHAIALGTTESTGVNRNGDGFKAAICKRNHGTFVKHGRAYRNHRNQDKSKSYGIIKLSHFNEPMGRIELCIAYNGNKEAAARNNGLIADEEIEKLAKNESFPASMALHEAYDTCSGCKHRSRSRAEYCTPTICTKYGGLRDNMCKTFADGHQLHADNDDPNSRWFDHSAVFRGADRICYTLGRIEKAAGVIKSGAELAEEIGMTLPPEFFADAGPIGPFLKVASDLSSLVGLTGNEALAFSDVVQPALTSIPDLQSHTEKLAYTCRALADEQIVLPVRDFLAIMLGDPKLAADTAQSVVPFVSQAYDNLLGDGESAFAGNPFNPSNRPVPQVTKQWATKIAADYSLSRSAINRRIILASIRGAQPKLINVNSRSTMEKSASAIRALAKQYALYKIAALAAISNDSNRNWIIRVAAIQDRVAH